MGSGVIGAGGLHETALLASRVHAIVKNLMLRSPDSWDGSCELLRSITRTFGREVLIHSRYRPMAESWSFETGGRRHTLRPDGRTWAGIAAEVWFRSLSEVRRSCSEVLV